MELIMFAVTIVVCYTVGFFTAKKKYAGEI